MYRGLAVTFLALATGVLVLPASTAYEQAGYARDDGNATRLRQNESVRARLVELQNEIAKDSKVTVGGLLNELEEARKKATDLDQLSAAVRAIESKARISGLMAPQKLEVGPPGSFDQCMTIEQVADELARQWIENIGNAPFLGITDRDIQGLTDMLTRHMGEVEEYLDAIKARPIKGVSRIESEDRRLRVRDC
jgi:hypothetical protein